MVDLICKYKEHEYMLNLMQKYSAFTDIGEKVSKTNQFASFLDGLLLTSTIKNDSIILRDSCLGKGKHE